MSIEETEELFHDDLPIPNMKCQIIGCGNQAICVKNTICVKHWQEKYRSKNMTEEMKDSVTNNEPKIEAKIEKETVNVEKSPVNKVEGILKAAKDMLSLNKPTKEIFETLIGLYIKAGKDPKHAKHNAQSTLFNARKKLGVKPNDNPTIKFQTK